jgi:hypothetical protein
MAPAPTPGEPQAQSGIMAGRIQSPDGHPAADVRVFAVQANADDTSEKTPILAAIGQTDRAGRFELQGLPYGSYYIAAGLLRSPTYYPGVRKLTTAWTVSVSGDAVKANLDFSLDPIAFEDLTEAKQIPFQPGAIRSTGKAVTATTKLAVRQTLQVEAGEMWWAARVVQLLEDDRVKIHYVGWDDSFDEVVLRSRLQLDDQAIEKVRRPAEWLGRRGFSDFPDGFVDADGGVMPVLISPGPGTMQSGGEAVIAKTALNGYGLPISIAAILTGAALASWALLILGRKLRARAKTPAVISLKSH